MTGSAPVPSGLSSLLVLTAIPTLIASRMVDNKTDIQHFQSPSATTLEQTFLIPSPILSSHARLYVLEMHILPNEKRPLILTLGQIRVRFFHAISQGKPMLSTVL